MSRVWKRFFFKVGKFLAFITYFLVATVGTGFISLWAGYNFEFGTITGVVVMILLPMCTFLIRDLYRDAKDEIERENREIMRSLKGL